ncbi:hypothetical protein GCM10009603_52330 [Nocardiopsis exhalans]
MSWPVTPSDGTAAARVGRGPGLALPGPRVVGVKAAEPPVVESPGTVRVGQMGAQAASPGREQAGQAGTVSEWGWHPKPAPGAVRCFQNPCIPDDLATRS